VTFADADRIEEAAGEVEKSVSILHAARPASGMLGREPSMAPIEADRRSPKGALPEFRRRDTR
jgi:hypothetical protein